MVRLEYEPIFCITLSVRVVAFVMPHRPAVYDWFGNCDCCPPLGKRHILETVRIELTSTQHPYNSALEDRPIHWPRNSAQTAVAASRTSASMTGITSILVTIEEVVDIAKAAEHSTCT